MGKDVDGCCEACKLFGDQERVVEPAATTPLEARREALKLVVHRGSELVAELEPASARVVVGRGRDSDVVLSDGTISRRQCFFEFRDGDVFVGDLKSSCGTYLNGRIIGGPTRVPEGATIYVGNFRMQIVRR